MSTTHAADLAAYAKSSVLVNAVTIAVLAVFGYICKRPCLRLLGHVRTVAMAAIGRV